MSSIITSIPTGAVAEWCVVPHYRRSSLFLEGCQEAVRNTTAVNLADFQSICCDGLIVDTALDIYNASSYTLAPGTYPNGYTPIKLSDLVCCGVGGTQTQALPLTPDPRTACAPGTTGTPLASLAATNASRADLFPVTYSGGAPASNNDGLSATASNDLWGWASPSYGASGTPMCFWANTAASGADVAKVTVLATYVAPTGSETTSTSAPASTSKPSAGFSFSRTRGTSCVFVTLGLMGLSLLLA
ncbi:hypothetical protein GGR54DRAFT_644001 [Hypoxylon sp. NC1633]|nr:hypothetical protein GGR54DRAFT_644001 [Hypoxylon sp. NC1633]